MTNRLALLLALAWAVPTRAAEPRRPNILVVLADDVGWDEFGFRGKKDIPTPRIDSIARDGVQFTQQYVSGPYCSPIRAGFFTGRYQTRFGHENNRVPVVSGLPLTETTIADRLRTLGYATGKWHLGNKPEFRPTRRGFDEFFGTLANTPYYHPTQFVDSRESADPHPVAAAGATIDPAWKLDGVDLKPYLTGQKAGKPHESLYWRFGQ